MARLPIPGSDSGTWGDVLNDYLLQAHASDGTLKTVGVGYGGTGATDAATARTNLGAAAASDLSAKADDSAVVHKTGAETVGGVKTFTSIPIVPDSSFSVAKLSFDPATQAELDAHAADMALHSSGRELAYAASTIQQTTTSAVQTNITGLEITFTVGSRPVMVELYLPWLGGTANATAGVAIRDGSNNDLQYAGTFVTASMIGNARVMERITTPGTYTRRGSFARSAGTGTVSNNVNLSSVVSMLRAIEV